MVRIHGNWCGPNWTAGKKIPAEALKAKDRRFPCDDKLDCACRRHDISIKDNGTSRASDQALQDAAQKILDNPVNLVINPLMYLNARTVRDGMAIAKNFRRK